MTPRTIAQIVRKQDINFSIKYDTMVVYGDLVLKDLDFPIDFPHENLWVKGDVVIENCPQITSLPITTITGNNLRFENNSGIKTWPKDLYADNITIARCSGYDSLFHTEVFADLLNSDCPGQNQDATKVLSYSFRNDDQGDFVGVVRNHYGHSVWTLNAMAAMTLHEMGYLKDIRSAAEIGSYLREIGHIDRDAKVFPEASAVEFWNSNAEVVEKVKQFSLNN